LNGLADSASNADPSVDQDGLEEPTFQADSPTPTSDSTNRGAGVFTSMVVHCGLLVLLALLAFPEVKNATSLLRLGANLAAPSESEAFALLEMADSSITESSLSIEAVELVETEWLVDQMQPEAELVMEMHNSQVENELQERLEAEVRSDLASLTASASSGNRSRSKRAKSALEWMSTVSLKGQAVKGPLLKEPEEGVRQTSTTSDAAMGILDQLRETAEHDGPVWIIWVMDASISLVAERQQLAPIVKGFYDDVKMAKKPGSWPWPTTAVYAFGQRVVPLGVNPGQPKPLAIANTLINMPIDESGTENVMTAVASAIANVPARNPDMRIEVVVWTDESGDDLNALEDVIFLCRQRNARVHVVGPLSVLGMRKGLQQFSLAPPYHMPILLPVDRGPDSAFPERAQLPYWYEATDIDWGNGPIIPANLGEQNFGGPHRQRLLAPSGPYGLTRLALATGGTFTALNRPGDLAAASREQLFDYMPDYRSALEIAYDIDRYPLRRAVIEAAALTETANYWPPKMRYPTMLTDQFPYRSRGFYVSPQTFVRRLPVELEVSAQRLQQAQVVIEQAIQIMMLRFQTASDADARYGAAPFNPALNEVSLDEVTPSEYHHEESPRWKAWYDLNLGRLLAHSVRIREYLLQCESLASPQTRTLMQSRGFNQLLLKSSPLLQGGAVSSTRTQTAVQLLQRVVQDHPDTPWGDLATWELEHAVGVEPVLSVRPKPVRPKPRPVRGKPAPAQPRPSLPNL